MRAACLLTIAASWATILACGSFSGSDGASGPDGGLEAAPPGAEGGTADGPASSDADAGSDSAGGVAPTEIASGLSDLEGIAATGSTVYVLEHDAGRVSSVPIDGGTIGTVDGNSGSPLGIVVANGSVYWSDFGGRLVKRQPFDGGASSSTTTNDKGAFAIAAASDRIVVATINGSVGEVRQFMFDLTSGPPVGALGNLFDVAVFGGDVYWTESGSGRIGHGKTGDATNDTFAMDPSDCQSIAADSSGVYWIKRAQGLIRSKVSGAVVDIASGEQSPHSLTADGTYLYWLTRDGKLRRLAHAPGSKPTTLAEGFDADFDSQLRARALALTPTYLVWITKDGRILRLPR